MQVPVIRFVPFGELAPVVKIRSVMARARAAREARRIERTRRRDARRAEKARVEELRLAEREANERLREEAAVTRYRERAESEAAYRRAVGLPPAPAAVGVPPPVAAVPAVPAETDARIQRLEADVRQLSSSLGSACATVHEVQALSPIVPEIQARVALLAGEVSAVYEHVLRTVQVEVDKLERVLRARMVDAEKQQALETAAVATRVANAETVQGVLAEANQALDTRLQHVEKLVLELVDAQSTYKTVAAELAAKAGVSVRELEALSNTMDTVLVALGKHKML